MRLFFRQFLRQLLDRSGTTFFHAGIVLAVVAAGGTTLAAVGENESSVRDEANKLHGTYAMETISRSVRAHRIQSRNYKVNEFARVDGRVFAVNFSGRVMPDLNTLLKTYFHDYQSTIHKPENRAYGRAGLSLTSDSGKLKIVVAGKAGFVQGLIYDPALVPGGVNVNELK